LKDKHLDYYDDSFNILFGTTNTEFDFFDNPYISVNVYELNSAFSPKKSDKLQLKKCSYEDKSKFINDQAITYYPNALCLSDKGKVPIRNSWHNLEFDNIFISLDACDDYTLKSNKY